MPWETFDRPRGKAFATVYDDERASLRPEGALVLNSRARKLLDGIFDVDLLYAADDHVLAIRPATGETPSYRLNGQGSISVAGLMNYYGLRRPTETIFGIRVEFVDGMIVVPLPEETKP